MRSTALLTAAVGALALAACQRQGGVNTAAASTPVPTTAASTLPPAPPSMAEVADAPAVRDLAERRPLRLAYPAPDRRYRWLDDAYWIDDVYGEAPPDYAFDYDDTGPVVWLDGDYVVCIGEPAPDGVRFYFFEPDDDWPYFVEDHAYGYGFDDGVLAVVYDSAGEPITPDLARGRLGFASRYFARGQALHLAARQSDRRQVSLAAWQADARAFAAQRTAWDRTLARDQTWQMRHVSNGPREADRWGAQRAWRVAETDVARSAVQTTPMVRPGQSSLAQQEATERAWRDQRALIDHQMAASQAAQRQLDEARAYAQSRSLERSGQTSGAPGQRPARHARAAYAGAYAAGGRTEARARFSERSFRAEPRFDAEARGPRYASGGAARSAFDHGAEVSARMARINGSAHFAAPRSPEPPSARSGEALGGGHRFEGGGGARAEGPTPHAAPQGGEGGGHSGRGGNAVAPGGDNGRKH
jgi:hypothetical protein